MALGRVPKPQAAQGRGPISNFPHGPSNALQVQHIPAPGTVMKILYGVLTVGFLALSRARPDLETPKTPKPSRDQKDQTLRTRRRSAKGAGCPADPVHPPSQFRRKTRKKNPHPTLALTAS